MKKVKESLNEAGIPKNQGKILDKKQLYAELLDLEVEENMIIALCNYFESYELRGFVEFLQEEWQ